MTQPTDHGKSHPGRGSVERPEKPVRVVPGPASSVSPAVAVTEAVRERVGEQNFRHWFLNRSRLNTTDDQLVVHVANPFICTWVMKRFRQQLTAAAVDILGPSAGFMVHVDAALSDSISRPTKAALPAAGSGSMQIQTAAACTDGKQPQLPSAVGSHRNTGKPARPATRASARRRFRSFRSFVSGPCNELSVMAARQVSEAPGERFNPLYLHGSTGVGKSHLLEAVYTTIRATHPDLNVLFLTSEAFTNYFTAALASRSVPSFRQRFRNIDVLLVDNIEFLGNKKATQEEFLHTIDQLTDHGGQLVLTADRHPRLLNKHREELKARFIGGLVCRIERPAECTRRKLVDVLALPYREQLSSGALNYVACHGGRNARELQGSLNCLLSHAALRGSRVTTSQARSLLEGLRQECRHLIQINDVERIVCEAFGISVRDMRSRSRRRAISCPRSIAMYVARKLTKAAWRDIGQYFGGRDHSTVVAAAKRVDAWINETIRVDLPNSCQGTTWAEVVQEIEERLLAMAS